MYSFRGRRFRALLMNTDCDRDTNEESEPTIALPYLPDNVIEKILSFLPIKDVARANRVSRQWASLWPSSPCERSKQKVLDKLRIRANINFGGSEILVREWEEFALKRCVKELDICSLDPEPDYKYLIEHAVLTSKFLTNLKLEKVRVYASSGINGPVSLPCLKSMSFTNVLFLDDHDYMADWALPSLMLGCPNIEHLSLNRCRLGYSSINLEITSESLRSLEILHCKSNDFDITTQNLESFKFYLDSTSSNHIKMDLWECDNLKNLDIYCVGLKRLVLHNCFEMIENSIFTPNLEFFEFTGYLKHKVHFVEAPSNLTLARIRVWETSWPSEHYSNLINFLQSFDCSGKVKIHIDAEGVTIPEKWRMEWSPPLPSIDQLQLYCSGPLGEALRTSLIWLAPSAEILPVQDHEDDSESEFYRNESEDEDADEDGDDEGESEDEHNDDGEDEDNDVNDNNDDNDDG